MKSKAPFAEAFQDLVYEVILPSILNTEHTHLKKNLKNN